MKEKSTTVKIYSPFSLINDMLHETGEDEHLFFFLFIVLLLSTPCVEQPLTCNRHSEPLNEHVIEW